MSQTIFRLSSPVGLDRVIDDLQVQLSTISWIEHFYPRAIRQVRVNDKKVETFFPEFWGKYKEPSSLMINDNISAHCFWLARDPTTFENDDVFDAQLYTTQTVSFIMWGNLKMFDPGQGSERNTEIYRREILQRIRSSYQFEVTGSYEQYDKVFEGFTLGDEYRQYLKPPFWAIRIDGIVKFPMFGENGTCGDDPGPTDQIIIWIADENGNLRRATLEEIAQENLQYEAEFIVGTDTDTGLVISFNALAIAKLSLAAGASVDFTQIIPLQVHVGGVFTELQYWQYDQQTGTLDLTGIGGVYDGTISLLFKLSL